MAAESEMTEHPDPLGELVQNTLPVTRAEIEVICRAVELALGVPNGVLDHVHDLSQAGRDDLEAFAEYRRLGTGIFQKGNRG